MTAAPVASIAYPAYERALFNKLADLHDFIADHFLSLCAADAISLHGDELRIHCLPFNSAARAARAARAALANRRQYRPFVVMTLPLVTRA